MRPALIALAVAGVLALWPAPAAAQPPAPAADNCATCHLAIGDARLEKPAKDFPQDIHRAKGFGCVACHGGNEKEAGMEAMDPSKGYIGKPDRKQVVQVCARCHSDAAFMKRYNPSPRVDQAVDYATSGHGRRLRESNDPKVAVCVSCHPAHSIRPPSDPQSSVHPLRVADTCGACHANATYMEGRRLPTDQVAKYRESVHAKAMTVKGDLSAPTCNDCHGNHGATPPGVSWVGNVCGQCHTVMAELFGRSVHAKAFAEMGTPGCATCHENHAIRAPSDAMLGLGGDAVCSGCHGAGDNGGKTAVEMRGLIDTLAARTEKARAVLDRAEHAGMEVSQAQFDLNGARDALVKARAAIHAFRADAVKREVEPGLAVSDKAQARGVRALDELRFRRRGLGVSLVVILAVIAGLVMKIRQVDRRQAAAPGRHE
jgi:predicted CXXCH cytochrome family protein